MGSRTLLCFARRRPKFANPRRRTSWWPTTASGIGEYSMHVASSILMAPFAPWMVPSPHLIKSSNSRAENKQGFPVTVEEASNRKHIKSNIGKRTTHGKRCQASNQWTQAQATKSNEVCRRGRQAQLPKKQKENEPIKYNRQGRQSKQNTKSAFGFSRRLLVVVIVVVVVIHLPEAKSFHGANFEWYFPLRSYAS